MPSQLLQLVHCICEVSRSGNEEGYNELKFKKESGIFLDFKKTNDINAKKKIVENRICLFFWFVEANGNSSSLKVSCSSVFTPPVHPFHWIWNTYLINIALRSDCTPSFTFESLPGRRWTVVSTVTLWKHSDIWNCIYETVGVNM